MSELPTMELSDDELDDVSGGNPLVIPAVVEMSMLASAIGVAHKMDETQKGLTAANDAMKEFG